MQLLRNLRLVQFRGVNLLSNGEWGHRENLNGYLKRSIDDGGFQFQWREESILNLVGTAVVVNQLGECVYLLALFLFFEEINSSLNYHDDPSLLPSDRMHGSVGWWSNVRDWNGKALMCLLVWVGDRRRTAPPISPYKQSGGGEQSTTI